MHLLQLTASAAEYDLLVYLTLLQQIQPKPATQNIKKIRNRYTVIFSVIILNISKVFRRYKHLH